MGEKTILVSAVVQVFFAFWVELNWCFGGGAMGQKIRAPFEG